MPTKRTRTSSETPRKAADPDRVDQSVLLDTLGYNCLQAYLCVLPAFVKRMAKFHLRPAEFSVLTVVKANPYLTQKRLSKTLRISPPNLATLLDRMEAKGLLQRQRNPHDKRSQMLVLTPEGLKTCNKAEAVARDADVTTMLTRSERAELLRLLQKVYLTPERT